jgi:hypothetical protein
MPDFSDTQGRMGLVVLALVLLVAGYLFWTRSAPPVPKPAPGQTLQNPFGTAAPGPGGAPAAQPNAPVGPSPNAPFARR